MQAPTLPGTVLVTGAGGFIGRSALERFPEQTMGAPHAALDIRDVRQVEQMLEKLRPWGVLNCAAQASVDAAETRQDEAWRINADAPGILARACHARNIRFCHISTDYVFGKQEDQLYTPTSPPCPVNVYGRSKAAGEAQVLSQNPEALVVRVAWVFGANSQGSGTHLLRELLAGRPARALADRFGHPTFVLDALDRCMTLMAMPAAHGIHHAVNAGVTSWLVFALRLAERLELPTRQVVPISRHSLPPAAPRPVRVALQVDPTCSGVALPPLRPWQDAQDAFLRQLVRRGLGM